MQKRRRAAFVPLKDYLYPIYYDYRISVSLLYASESAPHAMSLWLPSMLCAKRQIFSKKYDPEPQRRCGDFSAKPSGLNLTSELHKYRFAKGT